MIASSIKFKNHRCFRDHWSGLDQFSPITLIVGKNNSGKSQFLELIKILCERPVAQITGLEVQVTATLDAESLKGRFLPTATSGPLNGNHWENHGVLLEGQRVKWELSRDAKGVIFPSGYDTSSCKTGEASEREQAYRKQLVEEILKQTRAPFFGGTFRRLLAERNISAEPMSNSVRLDDDGKGATNIIRRFLHSTDPRFPRDLIRNEMLDALNRIFCDEGKFLEIYIQHIDGNDDRIAEDMWEIYLFQEQKGLVALSSSGSSLKTIFLVLLNTILVPHIDRKSIGEYVFAFEELENNLHPSLLRRLLAYLENLASPIDDAAANPPTFFLTTHSNAAMDYFMGRSNAQIVHVSHDGTSGRTQTVTQSSKQLEVIRDLGSRASDILQANGIIWVEGPSDRIYLNRWINIYSSGRFVEGRHYQCMFYGGGLLARLSVALDPPDIDELINLMRINPNAIVVSDSDKESKNAHLKLRVTRIRDEFAELDQRHAFHWILDAREIENYLTTGILLKAYPKIQVTIPNPEKHESFFPNASDPSMSYLEGKMNRKSLDKMELALSVTPFMSLDNISSRFELDSKMKSVVQCIEFWNQ